MKQALITALALGSLSLSACSRGYEPIEYGKDACAHCKMTIVDDRYAAELVTDKGRVYKFDDVICMKQYAAAQQTEGTNLLFVVPYLKNQSEPLPAGEAFYLKHEFFKSPMNGNFAAFADEIEAQSLMDSLSATAVRWEQIQ